MTPELLARSRTVRDKFTSVCRLPRDSQQYLDYINMRNSLNRDKREARNSHTANLAESYKNDASKLWGVINAELGKGGRQPGPDSMLIGDQLVTDPKTIANKFNTYFSSIGPQIQSEIPPPIFDYHQYLDMDGDSGANMYLNPTTPHEVEKTIVGLKNSKASGSDGITTDLLKALSPVISTPLATLVNCSFKLGVFPSILITAIVTPVFKKDDRRIFGNYRPISLLSILSKVFERLFQSRLSAFLSITNFLSPSQFGFRNGHTTIDAIAKLVADTLLGFDNGRFTVAVLLDVSKAFDSLDHQILLHKLNGAGVYGNAFRWLESYLSNRKQVTIFRDTVSAQAQLCCGVPQGSILGPLLFLVYVNDIPNCISHSSVIQYADDTTVYLSSNTLDDAVSDINSDLANLCDWLKANKLALSTAKTQAILFSKNSLHEAIDVPKVTVNDTTIDYQSTVNLLGLTLDSGLTWKYHIDNVHLKTSRALYALNRMKHQFSSSVLKLIYSGLIHSHLTYGILLWGCAAKRDLNALHIVQKKALRCIFHKPYNFHTAELFRAAHILNVFDLFRLENIKVGYKFLNSSLPMSLSSFFSVAAGVHTHNTRRATGLFIPRFRSEKVRRSFLYQVPHCWGQVAATTDIHHTWHTIAYRLTSDFVSIY